MSIARALVVGLVAGVATLVLVIAGNRADGTQLLALLMLPVAFLAGAAVFGSGAEGRLRRTIRGVLGAVFAAVVAIVAVFVLKDWTDWFEWPDEHGGDLFVMILAGLAAVPGGTAAASASPGQGLALAGGFSLGLGLALALVSGPAPAILVMLALGTIAGTLVSALARR